ncbi:MAG TPA: aminotransferase class III-fold pyridoxal phosphate-dependent enzyme [Candidatus Limnocylindrales bacterium]|nr:aminotransferase class III-fold pyridoxal phosphate-dependent enzyme [Candidatus Limnocylindrales bacterium]
MSAPSTSHLDPAVRLGRHLSPVLGRYFERTWSHGEGHRLYDTDGRAYLDFACSIAVSVLGHRHPAVVRAIHEQVDRLVAPTAAIGYSEPVVRLAELLADALPAPLDTVMFLNSGTEAVEAALKLARRATGRPGIVAFRGAFHGRTFGSTSVTSSNLNYRAGYEPLLPGVHILPFPYAYRDFDGDEERATEACLAALDELVATTVPASSIGSLLIEPVQGEGGYIPAPDAFLQGLRRFCDRHGILLITDEVQSGYGRTGRMWAFEHAGIVPDIVCIAKGIANGLPLAAIVSRRELQERWGKSAHGSTFGGNPVACAAAIAVLETIRSERLVDNAAERGAQLIAGLRATMADDRRIGDVRGRGLMVGVEFVRDRLTREPDGATVEALLALCADDGLLVLSCGREHHVVRFLPPLDVTAAEIDEALGIFRSALGRIAPDAATAGI